MPANIVDVDAFTDPIVRPVDADPADAASVQVPFQGLANRTRNLLNRLRGTVIDPSPATRSWWISPAKGYSQHGSNPGWGTLNGSGWIMSTGNVGLVNIPLDELPTGAVLFGLQVRVQPGAARVGANRMSAQLLVGDPTTPGSSVSGAVANDDGTTNVQTISLGFPAAAVDITIDKSTKWYEVAIAAGSTGGAAFDALFGVRVTILDPGPRNF